MSESVHYPGITSCGCPYIKHREPSKHWKECYYRLNCERDNPVSTAEPVSQEAVGVVLSEDQMGIGYDRRMGPVIWLNGYPPPGNLYTAPPSPGAELVELPDLRELLEMLLIDDARRIKHSGSWRQDLHGRATAMLARIDALLASLK